MLGRRFQVAFALLFVLGAPAAGWVPVLGAAALAFAVLSRVGVRSTRVRAVLRALVACALLVSLAELMAWEPTIWVAAPAIGVAAMARGRAHVGLPWVACWVLLAVVGVRCEASDPAARGWVRSAPIQGVHAGQSISVEFGEGVLVPFVATQVIDPDRPGVEAYASTMRETLRLAARHEPDERARRAMGEARVDVVPAVEEPGPELGPGEDGGLATGFATGLALRITSGTAGRSSRVGFRCPIGPTGVERKLWLKRDSCPRKYGSPGNAGLGAHPRWPGYAETSGRDRFDPARAFARFGPPLGVRSPGVLAMLLVALGALVLGSSRRRRPTVALATVTAVFVGLGIVFAIGRLPLAWPAGGVGPPLAWAGLVAAVGAYVSVDADPTPNRGSGVGGGMAAIAAWVVMAAWSGSRGAWAPLTERLGEWSESIARVTGGSPELLDAIGGTLVAAWIVLALGVLVAPRSGRGGVSPGTPSR